MLEIQAALATVDAGFFVKDGLFVKILSTMLGPQSLLDRSKTLNRGGNERNDEKHVLAQSLQARGPFVRSELSRMLGRWVEKQNFDGWIDRELGSEANRRACLEKRLTGRLDVLKSDCNLTDFQFKQLERAGNDDIDRYLETLEAFDRKFDDPIAVLTEFPAHEAESLQVRYLTDFGDESLLSTTLAKALGAEQCGLLKQRLAERNSVRYSAAIRQVATSLAKATLMTANERTAFENLLEKETSPPRRFGEFSLVEDAISDRGDMEFVRIQAARIPVSAYKAVFRDPLTDKIRRRLASWGNIDFDSWMKSHGFVPADRPDADAPGRADAGSKTF
jgi:hypothetical protein